ncbi:hypothetical protein FE784_27155 [Paenibacillus hemerocallicola]|uniref:Uncharacterized protein n=1 Tax=Paenibacillus hemerocallicola TaxID=1172614 RepID=A0A5C4T214_9BACL|nr:hypothetical protein [Paenibacillus hemerocallicola]TNJ63091.1 hypothetical protein FE784_27155 [Paenibacillus hemerocallicola]
MNNYIEVNGPVMGTTGNIALIETNNQAVFQAAIAASTVLNVLGRKDGPAMLSSHHLSKSVCANHCSVGGINLTIIA